MKPTWKFGRLAGVEIGAHWTVLFIVALITWSLGAGVLPDSAEGYSTVAYWAAAAMVGLAFGGSILAHEVSHAIVAGREGVPVEGIVLWMFGGMAKLRSHAKTSGAELRIALAGPATSGLIGAACLGLAVLLHMTGFSDLTTAALTWLGGINVMLAVFNLLPGAPLDGGRVLTAILWWRSGDELRARRTASAAGRILGQVLIGLGIIEFALVGAGGLWTVLVGWLIVSMARMEMLDSTLRTALEGAVVRDVMSDHVVTVPDDLTIEELLHGPWMRSRVSSFPVLDRHGRPSGIVTLKNVAAVPPERWSTTSLASMATPISELRVMQPHDMVTDLLELDHHDLAKRVLVVSEGRVVGIISPSDVARSVERLELLHKSSARH